MKISFLFFSAALVLAGCESPRVIGEYEGARLQDAGRKWSVDLREDGTFVVIRFYKNPKEGAPKDGESTMELGDLIYRGRWKHDLSEIVLRRDDGKVERLAVRTRLGVVLLIPQRADQPELTWTRIPGYD